MLEREMRVQQSASATHDLDINKSIEAMMHAGSEAQVPINPFVVAGLSNETEAVAVSNQFVAQCEGLDIAQEAFEYQIDPDRVSFDNVLALDIVPNLDADADIPDVFATN